jgi:tRNA(Ile)-lysidine synthase
VAALAGLPAAIRTRVLHAWARELGAAPGALSHRHVEALDALVSSWRGQGPTQLPGGIVVSRRGGTLVGCPGSGPATGPASEEPIG